MIAAGYSYRYAALGELALSADADWLSVAEQAVAMRMRDRGRRVAWMAGRYLVKQLLAERIPCERLAALEIHSVDAAGRHVRPQAVWRGEVLQWSLSISHSRCGLLAAVAPPGTCIGVDLVASEARLGRGFTEVWFSPPERRWLAESTTFRPEMVWGAKEAAYKAINQGERFSPHDLHVRSLGAGELSCRSRHNKHADCRITMWRTPQSEFALLATCPQHRLNCYKECLHD
jgi:phosphopantetheinyl transferase